jgi:hypothetical protein
LKDIIHCSLLGKTSPLLLPADQILLVQNEVRRSSSGTFDTDFAKMQSVIVSDPRDPHLLLVVINVAALSRQQVQLIKLVPIPYFENGKTFSLMLDYDTVILDQAGEVYSILTEQEEYDCIFNRCYVSDVARSINEQTCGVPQLLNRHLGACVSEEVMSTGVFIKPMLPDGVLFAFEKEVTTQLFCNDNTFIGPVKKLNGTGIMQLPNGCMLSVSDSNGRTTKVKGQPLYKMIDTEDLVLSINGPLSLLQAQVNSNFTRKMMLYSSSLGSHISSMVKQAEIVDIELGNQKTSIYILIGVSVTIFTLVLLFVILAYKHRDKFYLKIHDLRSKFTGLQKTVQDIMKGFVSNLRGLPPPVAPKPPAFGELLAKVKEKTYQPVGSPSAPSCRSTPSYISMSDVSPPHKPEPRYTATGFVPVESSSKTASSGFTRQYPRMTPFLQELSEANLAQESEEVEQLCNAKPSDISKV